MCDMSNNKKIIITIITGRRNFEILTTSLSHKNIVNRLFLPLSTLKEVLTSDNYARMVTAVLTGSWSFRNCNQLIFKQHCFLPEFREYATEKTA